MIIASDILDFLCVLFPVALLTHMAFRIGFAYGRSRGATFLFAGSAIIVLSFLFKIYLDLLFGSVDTFWLFFLSFTVMLGLILAFVGTSRVHSFMSSTRPESDHAAAKIARIAALTAAVFFVAFIPYFFLVDRPVYWRLGALCYVVSQVTLFGMTVFVAEFLSMVDKAIVSRRAKLARALAAYYLVEPIVWLTALGAIGEMSFYPLARLLINVVGVVVSLFVALLALHFIRFGLPAVVRQVKTTYVDTLRIKVLRDFYLISTGLTVFIFGILLAAESMYGHLRISTLENYAQLRLSAGKVAVVKMRAALQDVVLRLERSEVAPDPKVALADLQKNYDCVDAVGSADGAKKITFLQCTKSGITETDIAELLVGKENRPEENSIEISPVDEDHKLKFLIVSKAHSGYGGVPYAFALVDMSKILLNSALYLSGHGTHLRLISPDMKVVYSDREEEVGQEYQNVVLERNSVDANDLLRKLRVLSNTQFEGYSILNGQNHVGVGEYYVLITTPVEFQGYKGVLASIEPEDRISQLFWPANTLLIFVAILATGLFGGGFIIISVVFRWSDRLEKEVQNKVRELRSSEDKYRRIVENPYIGSFIMVDGRLIFSNARLAEILETEVDRLSGSDLSVFVEGKDYESLKGVFEGIISGDKSGDRWRVNGTTASGRHISLSGYSSVINLGNKRGVQSLVVDSTIEYREKEKLEQFERLESMATLAAGIAHDFNNILQVVLGSSQLLQRGLADSELKKYADNISNVALRGSDLSKRLLTFSRHKGFEQRRVFDINAIILESLPLFEETFPRTIKIETNLETQPIYVEGDQSQIQQVIFNLAVNARDAMPHGGTLAIKTEIREVSAIEAEVYQASPGTYAFVMIRDNGEGIPPELMSKVFEPFFTTKPLGKGTGLGLSVVYGIVRSHNGFLKVYSEVKKGTVFSIHLPLSTPPVEAEANRSDAPVHLGEHATSCGKRILFVDDEAGIREAAQFLLAQAGYAVSTAKDGMSAIDIYKKEWKETNLVVLDLNMPELSGREVLQNFTIINPDVRVLISTGYITPEERADLKGVVEVIEKPFDFDQLLEKVRAALETSPVGEG